MKVALLLAVLLFAPLSFAGPETFDGKNVTVSLLRYVDSTVLAQEGVLVGPGSELYDFGGHFDIDLHGNTVDILLGSPWEPDTFYGLSFSWGDGEGFWIGNPVQIPLYGLYHGASAGRTSFSVLYRDDYPVTSLGLLVDLTDVEPPPLPLPGPIPEPASLLLLGTGLVTLLRRKVQGRGGCDRQGTNP